MVLAGASWSNVTWVKPRPVPLGASISKLFRLIVVGSIATSSVKVAVKVKVVSPALGRTGAIVTVGAAVSPTATRNSDSAPTDAPAAPETAPDLTVTR